MSQTPEHDDSRRDDALLDWLTQDRRSTLDWSQLDDEQHQAEAAAALYALGVTESQPMPADVEQRLLAMAERHAPAAAPLQAVRPPWWASLRLAWGTASFASVLAVALTVRLLSLPVAQEAIADLNGVHIPMQPGPDQAGQAVTGEVVWDAQRGGGYLKLSGLPVNDPGREQYQLWIFDGTRDERYPVDGGVFNIVRNGEAEVWIRVPIPVREAALFAITVEKSGGTVVSDRGRIVALAKVGA